jgi:SNF2 family DNA or RNA helicase
MLEMRMYGQDAHIRKLIAEHPDLDEAVRQAAVDGTLDQLSQEIEYIARLRRLIGEAKAPPFAEELVVRLQGGLEKAVVMCWHTVAGQIVADTLAKHGIESVFIRGDVSPTERKANIDRFQSEPKCRVVIGNIRAAGTNITLTAASDIFMLEQSWSPADNMQALMRVHRIGQTNRVNATFVSLADTIDDVVVATLAEKTADIAAIDPTAFQLMA